MNKHDLIQKVKDLDGISQDERAYLIDLINTKKKYGLVWEDKPEDVEETLRTHLPVLQEVPEKRITGLRDGQNRQDKNAVQDLRMGQDRQDLKKVSTPTLFDALPTAEQDFEKDQSESNIHSSTHTFGNGRRSASVNHSLIEGDNLHALTALTFTHENKIDVIYIDPPYNTGNKDFKYNDSFVDKEDAYRHSKWLSFMDKRLRIAKRLLSDKGVIFISIDDNEQAQLKMLCDEVFGEENFLANVIWQKVYSPRMDAKGFSVSHDYVVTYRKNPNTNIRKLSFEQNSKQFSSFDKNTGQFYRARSLRKDGSNSLREDRPNLFYPIISPDGQEVFPIKPDGKEGNWRWSQETFLKNSKEGNVEWIKKNGKWDILVKQWKEDDAQMPPPTLWLNTEVGHNHEAAEEIKNVFGETSFSTPKPTRLLKRILEIGGQKDSTILDFFAGSGTTLHATMALNAEDGGRRQCILVTNNENNICEEVTYERNKRVIEGYTNAKGAYVAGLGGNHLRYYKTATVEREPSLRNKRQLTRLATELLCIKEDCYTPRATTDTALQAYEEQNKRLLLVYDDAMIDEALAYLKTWLSESPAESPIKVYVFSNGQYPYTEDFEEVLPHITLCALPDAIYKAYQHVLPKREKTKSEQDLGMGQDGQDYTGLNKNLVYLENP